MTDKSAAAVREFIFQHLSRYDEWGYTFEKPGSVEALTALIEEHYVEREEHDKVVQQRDELREALKWIKENITGWCFLGKADAMLKIEAAIKNTER